MKKILNIVFEGGGVKGIGLVGAVAALENAGYTFGGIAGTSAGAIIASLLASGYSSAEMKAILDETDYTKFKQKSCLDMLGLPGMATSIFIEYGIYSADYFENWLSGLLARKGVRVFGDIKNTDGAGQKYKFQAIASDITAKRLLVLPDDLARLGYDTDSFSVAKAVRMSMSIPVFFEPVRLTDKLGRTRIIVDGGLLSNYPLWLFEKSDTKTVGVRFMKSDDDLGRKLEANPIHNFIDYLKSTADTMLEAHDKQHVRTTNGDFGRTVFISPTISANGGTKSIRTTDFEITKPEADALYQNGRTAAERFLARNG